MVAPGYFERVAELEEALAQERLEAERWRDFAEGAWFELEQLRKARA